MDKQLKTPLLDDGTKPPIEEEPVVVERDLRKAASGPPPRRTLASLRAAGAAEARASDDEDDMASDGEDEEDEKAGFFEEDRFDESDEDVPTQLDEDELRDAKQAFEDESVPIFKGTKYEEKFIEPGASGAAEEGKSGLSELQGVGTTSGVSSNKGNFRSYSVKYTPQYLSLRKKRHMRHTALFCLGQNNKLRKLLSSIALSGLYQLFMALVVIANSIALGCLDPSDRLDCTPNNQAAIWVSRFCTVLYIVEIVIKVLAKGFVLHEGAFLRSGWNCLDLLTTAIGIVEFGMVNDCSTGALSSIYAIRYFRAIRPLRLVRYVPRMRTLVSALIRAFPYVMSVATLLIFFYTLLALIGTEVFGYTFLYHCVNPNDPGDMIPDKTCSIKNTTLAAYYCEPPFVCTLTNQNPLYNTTAFDDFGISFLMVFQSITLEGWTKIAYFAMDANGGASALYFVIMPLLGTFFFQNMYLATIQSVYGRLHSEPPGRKGIVRIPKYMVPIMGAWKRFKKFLRRPVEEDPKAKFWLYRAGYWVDRTILKSKPFYIISIGLIVVNILILAMYFHGQSDQFANVLDNINNVILMCFTLELFLKVFGLGIFRYFASWLNWVDLIVVVAGWIDFGSRIAADIQHDQGVMFDTAALLSLRGLRLVAILKIVDRWKPLRRLAQLLSRTLPTLAYTLLLMLTCLYVFTILGMHIFGGLYNFAEGKPGLQYDSFWNAFISVFAILGIEAWNEAMQNGIRATGTRLAAIFFASILAIPNFIILNLFMSVLLDQFSESAQEIRQERQEKEEAARKGLSKSPSVDQLNADVPIDSTVSPNVGYALMQDDTDAALLKKADAQGDEDDDDLDVTSHPSEAREDVEEVMQGTTLRVFGPDSRFRRTLYSFVSSRLFDIINSFFVLMSCLAIVIEKSGAAFIVNNPQRSKDLFFALDIFFFIMFFLEGMAKIVCYGFISRKKAYLRNFWNWVDLAAILGLLISLVLTRLELPWLRALLALRPLRFLTRFKSTRLILRTLWTALPTLPAVLPIALFVWILLAIVGVQLFAGKMSTCSDPTMMNITLCEGEFFNDDTGRYENRTWEPPNNNFDNVFQAFFTIFKCSTGEGWPDVISNVMAIVGVDQARVTNSSRFNAAYFLAFVPLAIWFVTGLVVGTVVDAFDEVRSSDAEHGEVIFTQDQRRWIQLQQVMIAAFPRVDTPPPKNPIRLFFYDLMSKRWFDYVIMMIVFANTVLLCFNTNDEAYYWRWDNPQAVGDVIFTLLYTAEFAVRFVAIGPRNFVRDGWNNLDVLALLTTFVGWPLLALSGQYAEAGRLLRLFKVIRLFKITKLIKRLRVLFKTITISLPIMFSAFVVQLVLLFVFATVGIFLFEAVNKGEEISDRANFQNFGNALFLVYRMSTGEAWEVIMHDVMRFTSDWAVLYFIVFTVIVTFIMTNLFVAIVLDNFGFVTSVEEGDITFDDVTRFINTWKQFDKTNNGSISADLLPRFLRNLKPPFGVGFEAGQGEAMQMIGTLNIKLHRRNMIRFPDLLLVLSQKAIGIETIPGHVYETASSKISTRWVQYQRRAKMGPTRTTTLVDDSAIAVAHSRPLVETVAANIIQREWRRYVMRSRHEKNGTGTQSFAGLVKSLVASQKGSRQAAELSASQK